jgi:spoIIIJ-associated protein
MSSVKKNFYGKEVADAIKEACDTLGVGQENLAIEVIETGSTGIFGLIRKKAHIRVEIKTVEEDENDPFAMDDLLGGGKKEEQPTKGKQAKKPKSKKPKKDEAPKDDESAAAAEAEAGAEAPVVGAETAVEVMALDQAVETVAAETESRAEQPEKAVEPDKKARETRKASSSHKTEKQNEEQAGKPDDVPRKQEAKPEVEDEAAEISEEGLAILKEELAKIVELMGFPTEPEVKAEGLSVVLTLRGEHEEALAGDDGKVVDSLQYLLRKIATRKLSERVRVTIDVGNFREKRLEELKVKAVELVAMVKEDGKTQVLPALNPQERREIHMVLQEDKDIRSRSVGDGLFKKILIYKPGKGKGGGRKRGSRGGGQKGKSRGES